MSIHRGMQQGDRKALDSVSERLSGKEAAMIVFLIIGAFAGIMLGLRFKVFVLGPATLLVTAAITVSGIASGHEPGMIALTAFGAVASLQIGYFVGGILQVMAPAHLLARTTVRYRPPKSGLSRPMLN
jgi:predicted phage tail protein